MGGHGISGLANSPLVGVATPRYPSGQADPLDSAMASSAEVLTTAETTTATSTTTTGEFTSRQPPTVADTTAAAFRSPTLIPASLPPADTVAEPTVDHLGRLRVTANRASGCLHCPGPGDENVGPLALASIDLPTADHPGVATIPTTGAAGEGSLSLADDDPPMAGNRRYYPAGAGCPANGSFRMIRSPGYLLHRPPGPGTEPCGQLMMHGWRNSQRTSCLAPAILGGVAPSCSGYRRWQSNRTSGQR